ncbi:iron chelate uptake ABC transporter family permease subunit [Saccharospirillum salsuginis]|uniref:High-affinity zinc uptake system membrane protein ZnuB n=1 Tax=Saccharospirillum salsuginis TaxID=418750 RepID=A0A918KI61_9GAMM|nr:iron chelate uptake ABC transporter family permease subunit [Saccharospirillum salsuginis]GGX64230.1 zinc ABC transporter permease [Saccharospirillum salsuginis]
MIELLWPALLAGTGIALIAGPLGSFMVWRRMAYFGDTMAHSGLLGVTLGVVLNIHLTLGIALVTTTLALLLFVLQRQRRVPPDTLLGILSHSALAIGMLVLAFSDSVRMDLGGLLFGDLLAVNPQDVLWVALVTAVALPLILLIWRPLLAITVHEDLARAEGIATERIRILYLVLIALVIAVAMKIVGILLITALMIIPAAGVRWLSNTPEQMAIGASVLGMASVWLGLAVSWYSNAPSGPAIVVTATVAFVVLMGVSQAKRPARS